jgi:hypothetical protein
VTQESNGYALVNDGKIIKFDKNGKVFHFTLNSDFLGDYRDSLYFKDKFYLYDRTKTKLMIKTIDTSDVRPWFDHKGNGGWIGRTIRLGHTKDHFILSKEGQSLTYVNLSNTEENFMIEVPVGGWIIDTQCLPHDRVILLTTDGYLLLYCYNSQYRSSEQLNQY